VHEVAGGEKHRAQDADQRAEGDETQQRSHFSHGGQAPDPRRSGSFKVGAHARSPPVAASMIFSAVASRRSNSAAMRPRYITRTRSLRPRTSGRSDEIKRIPMPARASSLMSRWIWALAPTSMPRVG